MTPETETGMGLANSMIMTGLLRRLLERGLLSQQEVFHVLEEASQVLEEGGLNDTTGKAAHAQILDLRRIVAKSD